MRNPFKMTDKKSTSYFADAQYDVKSPIVGFADTSPEGGSKICFRERISRRRKQDLSLLPRNDVKFVARGLLENK